MRLIGSAFGLLMALVMGMVLLLQLADLEESVTTLTGGLDELWTAIPFLFLLVGIGGVLVVLIGGIAAAFFGLIGRR